MGRSFCAYGGRTKKLIGCPQFLTQLHVARTFNYPIFKTESLDDMPFEQYKVLLKLLEQMNKEREEMEKSAKDKYHTQPEYSHDGMVQRTKKKGKTFRIINEQ